MFEALAIATDDKAEFYRELSGQLEALLAGRAMRSPTPPTPRRCCSR
jgi:hypothetical protein